TRSSANPKPTMAARPSETDSQSGTPQTPRAAATTRPAIITNSPWAKFTASVALYTSTNPRAMSAYIRPMSTPLESRSRKKPRLSGKGRRSLDVLDPDARPDGRLAAVLVGDGRGQLDLVPPRVEGVDHGGVLVGDETAAHLPGSRHFVVVGLEVLRQE